MNRMGHWVVSFANGRRKRRYSREATRNVIRRAVNTHIPIADVKFYGKAGTIREGLCSKLVKRANAKMVPF